MEGWIKIHRKSLHSSVMKNPRTWYFWCWCLMKAGHKEKKFPFNNKDIILKPGQFITGRKKALKELKNYTEQKYKTAISYLKSTNRITTKSTNRFTIISICNWGMYQGKTTNKTTSKVNNQQTTSNQPITTNKNGKNVKNEKKEEKKLNPLLIGRGQGMAFLKEFPGLTNIELREQAKKCNNYMAMSSTNYSNPGLFLRGWLRNYMVEKRKKEADIKVLENLPKMSEKERLKNLEKIKEIKNKFRMKEV